MIKFLIQRGTATRSNIINWLITNVGNTTQKEPFYFNEISGDGWHVKFPVPVKNEEGRIYYNYEISVPNEETKIAMLLSLL